MIPNKIKLHELPSTEMLKSGTIRLASGVVFEKTCNEQNN